jgi:hypothetical protein
MLTRWVLCARTVGTIVFPPRAFGPGQSEGRPSLDGENGAAGGVVVVKNNNEWQESRKKLKERKMREAQDGPASDEPAEFGFPMGGLKEQIGQLLDAARRKRRDA